MKDINKKNALSIAFIMIAFLAVCFYYRWKQIEGVENALKEHTLVIAEPMWNFDTQWFDKYLKAITERYRYQSLKIVSENGDLFFETKFDDTTRIDDFFSGLGLIFEKRFEKRIIYKDDFNTQRLGKIIVIWKDTSIYFYSYAFLVSLLLIVIVRLYNGILNAKIALESKIMVIERQMNELKSKNDYIESIFNVVPEGLITLDKQNNCIKTNYSFEMIIQSWAETLQKETIEVQDFFLAELRKQIRKKNKGQYSMHIDGYTITIDFSVSSVPSLAHIEYVISMRDITKLATMERQLAQSQKLEAVGRLAAGIAHEINTPTQYVLANIKFIGESYQDLADVMAEVANWCQNQEAGSTTTKTEKLCEGLKEADWEFLEEEIPNALNQSEEGLRRISGIVNAMKHFSHTSGEKAEPNDINAAIETTAKVATNEWKYVAELDLQLDPDLPKVPCYLDQLNQVFLSMIVNSAHAIEEKQGQDKQAKGNIVIKTVASDEHVIITIADDGIGMSKGVKEKVFDPFFTTKKLNEGTGQGLAISYDVIVNRHKGKIDIETEKGAGTTFTILLPLNRM